MSMDIWIGDNGWWSTTSGVFECIVEETRSHFKNSEQEHMKKIYMPLDEWYQGYIDLREINEECFNMFYNYCKKAMDGFLDSDRGKIPEKDRIPIILGNWAEVLRIMREDPRYRGQQESK